MSDQDWWDKFNKGMWTAGTPMENPFATGAERMGQDWARPQNGNNGGGGGGGLIILPMIVIAIMIIVPTLIGAAPGAVVVMAATRLFAGARGAASYGDAYRATAWALGLGAIAVMAWLYVFANFLPPPLNGDSLWGHVWLGAMIGAIRLQSLFMTDLAPLDITAPGWAMAAGAALLAAPSLIVFALTLNRVIGHPYAGWLGFLRGLVAGFATIAAVAALSWAIWRYVAPYARPLTSEQGVSPGDFAMLALGFLFFFAVIWGVTAYWLFRLAATPRRFAGTYGLAVCAMALSGASLLIALFFFREGDLFLSALTTAIFTGTLQPGLTQGAGDFALLAAPGAALGAAFAAAKAQGVYSGFTGYLRALGAMALATASGAPLAIAATTYGIYQLTYASYG